LPTDPGTIIHALDYATKNLDIGHKYEEVTIFLTPGFAQSPHAGSARSSDAWVTKSTFAYDHQSYTRIILHEYVHTRQAFNQGAIGGMSWVIEGSADYFSYKLAQDVGVVSSQQYNNWLQNGSQTNAALSERETWESEYVPYSRGGVYLAILDHRIQETSNNSVETVFRRINAVGGDEANVLVQRSLFLDTVENTSSVEVRNWANKSIDSAAPYNVTTATADTSSNSVLDELADQFENRTAKKPYMSFIVAVMMGVVLGMLPYEISRSKEEEAEGDEETAEEDLQ